MKKYPKKKKKDKKWKWKVLNIPKLFITYNERFMDEFKGSVKELRVFTIPKANVPSGNLHLVTKCATQQKCNSTKQIEILVYLV